LESKEGKGVCGCESEFVCAKGGAKDVVVIVGGECVAFVLSLLDGEMGSGGSKETENASPNLSSQHPSSGL
jgi:hypothetical protein